MSGTSTETQVCGWVLSWLSRPLFIPLFSICSLLNQFCAGEINLKRQPFEVCTVRDSVQCSRNTLQGLAPDALLLIWIREIRSHRHLGDCIPNVMVQKGEFLLLADRSLTTLFKDDHQQQGDYDHLPNAPSSGCYGPRSLQIARQGKQCDTHRGDEHTTAAIVMGEGFVMTAYPPTC